MKSLTHKCKSNDVVLKLHYEGDKIHEVWAKIEGETSWIVIGYNDLISGVIKVAKKQRNTKSI